jgi:hypothetical protein
MMTQLRWIGAHSMLGHTMILAAAVLVLCVAGQAQTPSPTQPLQLNVTDSAAALANQGKTDEAIALLLQHGTQQARTVGLHGAELVAVSSSLRKLSMMPTASPKAAALAADTAEQWGDKNPAATSTALLLWSNERKAAGDVGAARGLAARAAALAPGGAADVAVSELGGRDLTAIVTAGAAGTGLFALAAASGFFVAASSDREVRTSVHGRSEVDAHLAARSMGSIVSAVAGATAAVLGVTTGVLWVLNDPPPPAVLPPPLQPLPVTEVEQ